MFKFFLVSVVFFVCVSLSQSENKLNQFIAVNYKDAASIRFSIDYTAGTHKGIVKTVKGGAFLNSLEELQGAQFQFEISDMDTGNATRDCHMREALGLDYSISDFPKKHVCDSGNALPLTGPNSVQFSSVSFVFGSFEESLETPLKVGDLNYGKIAGTIEMHGIKRPVTGLPIQVKKIIDDTGFAKLEVITRFEVRLKDFNIVVKPVKIGPFSIGVSDNVTIDVRLPLTITP